MSKGSSSKGRAIAESRSDLAARVAKRLESTVARHQAGDLDGAEAGYREILDSSPEHPHVLHLLGVIKHQRGDQRAAIELIRHAIAIAPRNADYHSNLGAAYYAERRFDEAEACFRSGIEINPLNADSHSNLAAVLADRGRTGEAAEHYRLALVARPDHPKYLVRLGELQLGQNQHVDAAETFERYLTIKPDDGAIHNNLAYCYEQLGRLKQARVHYERAVELVPDSPEINNNLGSVLGRLGELEKARKYFDRALAAGADKWENLAHLAGTYLNRRDFVRALSLYEQLLEREKDDARLWNDYGCALSSAGREHDALQKFTKALEIEPNYPEAWNNLGSSRLKLNDAEGAVAAFKKSIELRPRYLDPHINVCLALAFLQRLDEAAIYAKATILLEDFAPLKFTNPHKVFRAVCDFEAIDELGDLIGHLEKIDGTDISASFLELLPLTESKADVDRLVALHKRCGSRFAKWGDEAPLPPIDRRRRRGKLRLGLLSSDLRSHSVARFVKPLISHYDRDRFEIFCYSPYADSSDRIQQEIKGRVEQFRIVENKSARGIAGVVREDGIDVLFDLNGYTKDSLIDVLAHRAAPVQVYWLGYPFTTGMPEIDYILVDPHYLPEDPNTLSEKPLVMPESWVCFDSFEPEPISDKLPVERSGVITFGTMNNTYKFTRDTVAVWSKVMQQVPDSRFFLVRPQCQSPTLCTNLAREFGRHGIGPERLFFIDNHRVGLSHFSFYDEIDITLDTFPLTGGTTTCDSMWMGVPCITLVGPALHQRLSYALLNSAGAGELCAKTREEYVDLAVRLANDQQSLREYRYGFRPALLASPLCQGERFTRNFEETVDRAARENGI